LHWNNYNCYGFSATSMLSLFLFIGTFDIVFFSFSYTTYLHHACDPGKKIIVETMRINWLGYYSIIQPTVRQTRNFRLKTYFARNRTILYEFIVKYSIFLFFFLKDNIICDAASFIFWHLSQNFLNVYFYNIFHFSNFFQCFFGCW